MMKLYGKLVNDVIDFSSPERPAPHVLQSYISLDVSLVECDRC
jgi:hypothetical protein